MSINNGEYLIIQFLINMIEQLQNFEKYSSLIFKKMQYVYL